MILSGRRSTGRNISWRIRRYTGAGHGSASGIDVPDCQFDQIPAIHVLAEKKGTRFARPVRWLLCLYGHQEVNFDFAGVLSSRHTYGHRFLSRGAVELVDTDEYFRVMADNHVILDKQNRKELILKMLTDNAAELDGRPLYTPELLEEVSQLVEYPEVVRGSFFGGVSEHTPPGGFGYDDAGASAIFPGGLPVHGEVDALFSRDQQ